MRIIAGEFGGIRLAGLKGAELRPTLDRVRESLFSQLAPEIGNTRFLDLFAGTGAIGLEALSRGAAFCTFVERDSKSRDVLQSNLQRCRIDPDRYEVLATSASRAVPDLERRGGVYQMVYVDPPFAEGLYDSTLATLAESPVLDPEGLVIVEHFHKNPLQTSYDRLALQKERRLGDTILSFYRPVPVNKTDTESP